MIPITESVQSWLLAAHLIGLFIWLGGLFTSYWLIRLHVHAPADMREKLTLMERSIAMMMDIGATLAIVGGLVMAIRGHYFGVPNGKWLHAKLTIVVLGILPVHGLVRARIGKLSRGQTPTVPAWPWSVLLAAIVAIVILVVRKPF